MYEDLDIFSQQPLRRFYEEDDICELSQQLENAQVQGNTKLERVTYKKLGAAYWSRKNYGKAAEFFQEFLTKFRNTGDRKSEGNANWNLAITYDLLAQFPKAISYYEKARRISQELDKKECAERMYENLGNAYLSNCQYQKAISFYKLCLNVAKRDSQKKSECRLCASLGRAYKIIGAYKEAIHYLDESLLFSRQMRDKVEEKNALSSLGKIYVELENFNEASKKFKKSLDISKSLGNNKAVSHALLHLGHISFSLGKYDEAMKYYADSLKIAEELDDQGRAHGGLGDVLYKQGKYDDAIEHYQNYLENAREMEDRNDERIAHERLGDTDKSLERYSEAIAHYQQCLSIAENMKDKKSRGRAHGRLGKTFQALDNHEKAIKHCQKSISATKEINDTMAEGKANAALGDIYYSLQLYGKARICYEEYLAKANKANDLKNKRNAYNILGKCHQSQHKYQEAIDYHEKSLNLAKELKDLKGQGEAYMLLGDVNQLRENYRDSMQYYRMALKIYAKIGDQGNKRKVNGKLGFVSQLTNDFQEAAKYYDQALKVTILDDDKCERAELYDSLGDAYHSQHKYPLAIENHEKYLHIALEICNEKAQISAHSKLGNSYLSSGNYLKALEHFLENQIIAESIEDDSGTAFKANAYANLVSVYFALGQYEKANYYYGKYLEVEGDQEKTQMKINVYHNLGKAYLRLRQFKRSISLLTRGLDIAKRIGDDVSKSKLYGTLGNCYYHSKEYLEAIEIHNLQLKVAMTSHNPILKGEAYVNIANALLARGDAYANLRAKEYLKRFENINFEQRENREWVETYTVIGAVYRKIAIVFKEIDEQEEYFKRMERSVKFLKKSCRILEHHIDHLKDRDDFKISIVDTFIESYKELTLTLVRTGKIKEALSICDSGRARALRDHLISKYGVTGRNAVKKYSLRYSSSANVLKKGNFCIMYYALIQDCLLVTTSMLAKQHQPICLINGTDGSNSREVMERSIHEIVKSAYKDMGVLYDEDDISHVENEADSDNPNAENSLDITQHYEAEGDCQSETTTDLVVTRPPLPIRDKTKALRTLFEILVAPTLSKLNHKPEELVIIPDESLNRVPYAALLDQSGKFLSETFRIWLAPSLATLKLLQECPKSYHSKAGALIICNPAVGKVKYKGKAGNLWKPLLKAEEESEFIGEMFNVTPLIGCNATKDVVLEKLKEGVAVIHFATHGAYDYGEIVLAPSPSARAQGIPNEKDYILTVKEVEDIKGFKAQLVVLNCCNTGRGDIKAEGVVGMARAFLAAGARAVVATLWKTYDNPSFLFTDKFYSNLKQGKSTSTSLQHAMKYVRSSKKFPEPKYWAPYFLMGDNVTVNI